MSTDASRQLCAPSRVGRQDSAGWAGILLFLLVVLGPFCVLLISLLDPLRLGRMEWFGLAIPQGRRLELLLQSVGLAGSVAVGGILLGIVTSLYLSRWRPGLASYLRWFIFALAPIPPFIHAMAWSSVGAELNSALRGWGLQEVPFRGPLASWWVQLMALAPLAISLVWVGLESVDTDLIEAARLLRPDIHNLYQISLPLAAPVILAAGGLLFLLSLVDYSVPSLFQMNVYALDVFAEYSANNQSARAFLVSVPMLAVTAAAVILLQSPLKNAVLKPPWRRRSLSSPPLWPRWLIWSQRAGLVVLLVQVLVPVTSLLALTGSWGNLRAAVSDASQEIAFSMGVALVTALLGLPLAYSLAAKILSRGKAGRGWWLVLTAPLALPAPLIGIGLILIWNRPALSGIYGTAAMPVLASLARFAPMAAVIVLTQLRRIDPSLIEAARILETSPVRTWVRIRLPMLAPGLLAAAGVLFVLSLGELGATLLVAPPGRATLTMRIYNFLHYGASDTVAGLCLMLTGVVLLFGLMVVFLLAGWSRLLKNGRAVS